MSTRIVSYRELRGYGVRYSRKHLRDLMSAGLFPRHRQVSANRIGWLEDEIVAWIEGRPTGCSLERAAEIAQ